MTLNEADYNALSYANSCIKNWLSTLPFNAFTATQTELHYYLFNLLYSFSDTESKQILKFAFVHSAVNFWARGKLEHAPLDVLINDALVYTQTAGYYTIKEEIKASRGNQTASLLDLFDIRHIPLLKLAHYTSFSTRVDSIHVAAITHQIGMSSDCFWSQTPEALFRYLIDLARNASTYTKRAITEILARLVQIRNHPHYQNSSITLLYDRLLSEVSAEKQKTFVFTIPSKQQLKNYTSISEDLPAWMHTNAGMQATVTTQLVRPFNLGHELRVKLLSSKRRYLISYETLVKLDLLHTVYRPSKSDKPAQNDTITLTVPLLNKAGFKRAPYSSSTFQLNNITLEKQHLNQTYVIKNEEKYCKLVSPAVTLYLSREITEQLQKGDTAC